MIETFHIVLAMKPVEGGFAENARKHGVAGLNLDECRIEGVAGTGHWRDTGRTQKETVYESGHKDRGRDDGNMSHSGRWPANVIHDGSDGVMEEFPSLHGAGKARSGEDGTHTTGNKIYGEGLGAPAMRFGDEGSVARFFFEVTEFEETDV